MGFLNLALFVNEPYGSGHFATVEALHQMAETNRNDEWNAKTQYKQQN
jgi:hypothetical protein